MFSKKRFPKLGFQFSQTAQRRRFPLPLLRAELRGFGGLGARQEPGGHDLRTGRPAPVGGGGCHGHFEVTFCGLEP